MPRTPSVFMQFGKVSVSLMLRSKYVRHGLARECCGKATLEEPARDPSRSVETVDPELADLGGGGEHAGRGGAALTRVRAVLECFSLAVHAALSLPAGTATGAHLRC
eukprot:scaffold2753_cov115-Isochrysis_galbana.AAC.6